MKLSKVLFWDTNYDTIDWDGKAAYVIERVVTRGTMDDWNQAREYYGLTKIKEVVLNARSLDKKTHNFLSVLFDLPMEEFRCYKHRQSIPQHFPY